MAQFSSDNEDDLRKKLQDAASQAGVKYDETDLQGVQHRDYSDQAVQSTLDRYNERASNTPTNGAAPAAPKSAASQSMPSVGGPPAAYAPNNLPNVHLTPYQPAQLPTGQYQQYQAQQLPNEQYQRYQPTQLPGQQFNQYQAGQISQFQQPQNQAVQSGTQGLVQQLLSNPHSLSDQAVSQMQEKQKEDAIQMQQAANQQAQQSAVGRGVVNGGALQAGQRRSMDQLVGSVLNSNRQVDLYRAQQDRADELNAANAGNAYLTSDMARQAQGYQTQLQGQESQANQNLQSNQSQNAAVQYALQQAQAQSAENQQGVQSNNAAVGYGLQQSEAQGQQNLLASQSQNAATDYALRQAQAQANENMLGNQGQNNAAQFDMANFFNNEQLRQAASNSQFQGWNAQTGFNLQSMAQQLAQQQFLANLNYQYQRDAQNNNFNYAQLYAK